MNTPTPWSISRLKPIRSLLITLLLGIAVTAATAEPVAPPSVHPPATVNDQPRAHQQHKRRANESPTVIPGGKAETLQKFKNEGKETSAYSRWKMRLSFWPRKAVVFAELALIICLGVLLGQVIEVAGLVRYLAVIAWPLLKLGGLPRSAGAAFVMAFQSGAVANTMLVTARDEGLLSKRQLYTSVLVVSCLSLFAHLPTFILPLAAAFGATAAAIFFGVRFGAILAQIIVMLLISNLFLKRFLGDSLPVPLTTKDTPSPTTTLYAQVASGTESGNKLTVAGFCSKVWQRSRPTLARLLIFVIPTFFVMSGLEWWRVFDTLELWLSGFSFSWLPPQAPAVVAAQLVSLYNGAIVAGSFIDSGAIDTRQAVAILLFGSIITAPVRTLKHALPTYAAVLGLRPGTALAVSAQVLRVLFLGGATVLLIRVWH